LYARFLAGCLIIGATTTIGRILAGRLAARETDLRQFETALEHLATEVRFRAATLPAALRAAGTAAGRSPRLVLGRTAALLTSGCGMSAGEAWERALEETDEATALLADDVAVLRELAPTLGRLDSSGQLRQLELVLARLRAQTAVASRTRAQEGRLWLYTGVASGAGLTILLL